ncbi:MAG TPA: acyl-CoA dehydrogenase family protein, partial [Propionibacteriaceae bacterium]|nr:acyl-CoA dehydrogenase family protein [Propionibacteriaceae bacterium]
MRDIFDLYAIDTLLSDEERAIRETVARFGAAQLRPHVAQWFEDGLLPARDIARRLGEVGVLGMHLTGFGCAGTNAVSYGLACLELEAVDSGLRSLVSVQGSLAMFAIHAYGSEEQKEHWLPPMAAGEVVGCFGLTEPDFGSNPAGMRTSA